MTILKNEVLVLTRNYVRSGGKDNRRQQLKRMLAFTKFCRDDGAVRLAQIGQKHVMDYYRHNKHLSYPTIYNHFLAIAKLFDLSGKKEPPRPSQ
ncbi:MAG: hypothetical protein GX673_11690 [Gammaproteobacteria bacterium]|nr:hypothetical protein [Gammaproteobacteria bacterium]